ncbi:MAG: PIG-L family deacetylase [Candidatus Tectomicrobia bacterium]|uniref:PIG-L family deacetylase n=1 Tax=Tectimicrobiota bacterium TaxID=2528274 RepID=A0A933GKS6_UNCTE|nr:PIG-L family deacetylase [Candidatus Tectomicrobia bacterium]
MQSNNAKRAMVIVAHPDDAELGAGGFIARLAQKGFEIRYIICTNGNKGTKDSNLSPHKLAEIREVEQREAAKVLGVSSILFLRHEDGDLEPNKAFRMELAILIREFQPETIITHDPWRHYLIHPDHRAVGITVMDAIVSARDHLFLPVAGFLGFEAWAPREIFFTFPENPDYYEDISETMEIKLKATSQHLSQIGSFQNWENNIKNRARELGKAKGFPYAEAYKRVELH